MNCGEFRVRHNLVLDKRTSDEKLDDHLLSCELCRDYIRQINDVGSGLGQLPRLPLPENLLEDIRAIPLNKRRKRIASLRQVLFGAFGVIVYILAAFMTPATVFIVEIGLSIFAFTLVAINILKRPLLNS